MPTDSSHKPPECWQTSLFVSIRTLHPSQLSYKERCTLWQVYQSGFIQGSRPAGPYTEIYEKELVYEIVRADMDYLNKSKMSRAESEREDHGQSGHRLKLLSTGSQERRGWNSMDTGRNSCPVVEYYPCLWGASASLLSSSNWLNLAHPDYPG